MTHGDGLNMAQKEAVLHISGPLLIVAGAGAGKTKTITHRIAHLIQSGIYPERILAVTFTNKAAGEMRTRIDTLLDQAGKTSRKPLVSTFHSLGVRLLREFATDARLNRNFVIWDRDDSIRAIKSVLKETGEERYNPRLVLSVISRAKGDALSQAAYAERARLPFERAVAIIWEKYDSILSASGALDFDDILAKTLSLLQNSPEVRKRLQERWSHITIDEYQDTNTAQYEIARLLSGDSHNICAVGDIDQNIYSWRGASIVHLLSFEKTYPGTKTVLLEQNYRSTKTILTAANAVIAKNVNRHEKRLFTENPTGDAIVLFTAHDERHEAQFVVQTARELIASGVPASQIAVLFRENFQSRALEEAFIQLGIPYRVLGTRFFERKEIKDMLSYLRAALNPDSHADIERIVASPPRGIGKQTLDKLREGKENSLSPAARAKVFAFRDLLSRIRTAITAKSASGALHYTLIESGLKRSYENGDAEDLERLANVQELLTLATRYDALPAPEGIERLLEDAALMSDQDSRDETVPAVSLMTVHASKGLEFDVVFVTGLEQGLFPSVREGEAASARDPEEERRLFYVALTRARHNLFLAHALTRAKYGGREFALPSEFLEDIDPRLLATEPASAGRSRGILDSYDEEDTIT